MILFWSRKYVTHLEAEISWLKLQMDHERQRAEEAINDLLSIRVQANPLTATSPAPTIPDQVERLLRDPEFVSIGSIDG